MIVRAYYGSRISENITRTPEGYLICMNVPIARTGIQEYLRSELGLDGDPNEIVKVMRTEKEVFSPETIASFEGKTVTDEHPPESVNPGNIAAYGHGHVQNVHRGAGEESDLLIGDLVINTNQLIDDVVNWRKREVSCGYDCEYYQDESGQLFQRSIRGNHVAVVPAGRAGSRVAIKDSDEPKKERGTKPMEKPKKKNSLIANLFSRAVKDMEPGEIADTLDEIRSADDETPAPAAAPAPAAPASDCKDDDNTLLQQIAAAVAALSEEVKALKAASHDEKPADPLDALASELSSSDEETSADQETSETIPADELPGGTSDEEGVVAPASALPENPIPGADRAIALAAINTIKPIIAKLPESERRAASDAAAAEIRKLMSKDAKPKVNGYAAVLASMKGASKAKAAADAKKTVVDQSAIGKNIMAKYNPHYKQS